MDYFSSADIQKWSLRRSVSECGNLDVNECFGFGFEIATPCCARFAMTRKDEQGTELKLTPSQTD